LETSKLPSNPHERNPYPCRKCGKTIYWHRAQSGKNYPCDSATDRKALHQCTELAEPKPQPITPSYFSPEPSIEERIAHLEEQVKNLIRTVKAVESRQPIDMSDVGF